MTPDGREPWRQVRRSFAQREPLCLPLLIRGLWVRVPRGPPSRRPQDVGRHPIERPSRDASSASSPAPGRCVSVISMLVSRADDEPTSASDSVAGAVDDHVIDRPPRLRLHGVAESEPDEQLRELTRATHDLRERRPKGGNLNGLIQVRRPHVGRACPQQYPLQRLTAADRQYVDRRCDCPERGLDVRLTQSQRGQSEGRKLLLQITQVGLPDRPVMRKVHGAGEVRMLDPSDLGRPLGLCDDQPILQPMNLFGDCDQPVAMGKPKAQSQILALSATGWRICRLRCATAHLRPSFLQSSHLSAVSL